MSKTPIAVQIWSVREEFGKDMAGTLAAIAEMGYAGVELCRWYTFTDLFDKWDAKEIRKVCDDVGLKVVSSHMPYTLIQEDRLPELIEFSHVVGMAYAVVAALPKELVLTRTDVLEAASRFNAAAARLKAEGIRIGYHNHPHDFQPIDGEMPWDIFFSNTDPEVIMQWDVGNALSAGVDPYVYLERYAGRSTLVHLKEYSAKDKWVTIGKGDVDWGKVFDLCERLHQPEWYIVEQEAIEGLGSMARVQASLEHLRGMGK
jgi:sugar phosphate isomerase/epimerase